MCRSHEEQYIIALVWRVILSIALVIGLVVFNAVHDVVYGTELVVTHADAASQVVYYRYVQPDRTVPGIAWIVGWAILVLLWVTFFPHVRRFRAINRL